MERAQELEWGAAQRIEISEDLISVAKHQLKFLAAVDRNRWLYQGPPLDRAIYRYNNCWLPLLAKHSESPITEGPLVVPLDCEWIWHCHRLNPVRYKSDCEEFFGRILDNKNVVTSVEGTTSNRETEQVWNVLYPNEPYNFDSTRAVSHGVYETDSGGEKCTKYDLVSAVERQSPFFYQVSRPYMNNDKFLKTAVARYKGFLHLIKTNRAKSLRRFCVPTYDIDLIWHSHQLHSVSYCKDLVGLIGKVLEHDDTDSDRTKGKKLDVGFSETTAQWEETYGSRYWRAGAMYRGNAPSPLGTTPFVSNVVNKKEVASNKYPGSMHFQMTTVIEVLLEFVEVKNLPEGHKGNVFVFFRKSQPDAIFKAKRRLSIQSESGKKQVASFHCQPNGHLIFELASHSPSNLRILKPGKIMGTNSISFEEMLKIPDLYIERWLDLRPVSGTSSAKPIALRVAISFTVPTPGTRELHMVRSLPVSKYSCFFPLPWRVPYVDNRTPVKDIDGSVILSLEMRGFEKTEDKKISPLRKEVVGTLYGDRFFTAAEFDGTKWSLLDSQWSFLLFSDKDINKDDGHLFELVGPRAVKLFSGRKLEYEAKHCQKRRNEHDFVTLVEFSAEDPYGKAVALLDLKTGSIKGNEKWVVLLASTLAFILSDILKKEGYNGLAVKAKNSKETERSIHEEGKGTNLNAATENVEVANASVILIPEKGGACGGCGGGTGCGNAVESGGCGASGCGNMVESGGCGGCGGGSGCGNMAKCGGCGGCGGSGGCGASGCGNMVESGGCGGCGGGSGCGNMAKCGGSGGCGGCGSCGGCGGCGAGGFRSEYENGNGGARHENLNEAPIQANDIAVLA